MHKSRLHQEFISLTPSDVKEKEALIKDALEADAFKLDDIDSDFHKEMRSTLSEIQSRTGEEKEKLIKKVLEDKLGTDFMNIANLKDRLLCEIDSSLDRNETYFLDGVPVLYITNVKLNKETSKMNFEWTDNPELIEAKRKESQQYH